MGLVDYSSSEEDDNEVSSRRSPAQMTAIEALPSCPPPQSLPPLPRAFHDLYAATARTSLADDPSLHQGRHRAIPHVTGQWPSHLYIECESSFLLFSSPSLYFGEPSPTV